MRRSRTCSVSWLLFRPRRNIGPRSMRGRRRKKPRPRREGREGTCVPHSERDGTADADAPDIRARLDIIPGEGAEVPDVEHVAQRTRVVVAHDIEELPDVQPVERTEDQGMAHRARN